MRGGKFIKKWNYRFILSIIVCLIAVSFLFSCKIKGEILNKNTELHYLEENYFLICVGKYKELSDAEYDKERLKKIDFNPYIIKTYDDDEYFLFYLFVSCHDKRKKRKYEDSDYDSEDNNRKNDDEKTKIDKDQDEAREKAEDLIYSGIAIDIIPSVTIKPKAEKYDEIIKKNSVEYEIPKTIMPDFSEHVVKCIKQFPINRDFKIKELHIFDLENMRTFGADSLQDKITGGGGENEGISSFIYSFYYDNKVLGASLGFYEDTLYNRQLYITIKSGNAGSFELEKDKNAYPREFLVLGGIVNCNVVNKDNTHILEGVNQDGSMCIEMGSLNFTDEEFNLFLDNLKNDSGLLVYPQVRKNLLILPEENKRVKRDFLSFSLTKIPRSYAIGKDNVDWAVAMVGHWDSSARFNIENEDIIVSFFDLEYDYIAKEVQNMFVREHEDAGIFENNQPIDLKHTKGWFIREGDTPGDEVSFCYKSYSIAVDSDIKDRKETLIDFANDLQIWK